ncbi:MULTISPECIES: DoxX family protein [Desulfosediminicola]|uniref:DoxX family protein n=1 Tax=Desulfosediminicola TaxID=2886823 RepID=UPI0010AD3F72|nr:DoxX family protein [Desulfosediminicola ganghwensis]
METLKIIMYVARQLVIPFLLAAFFIAAGYVKLDGDPGMVANFERWGYPAWSMYLVGLIEILGAALLVFARARFYGALVIVVTMTGALLTHWQAGEMETASPAMILWGLAAIELWRNQKKRLKR